jgi:hypothetical protein
MVNDMANGCTFTILFAGLPTHAKPGSAFLFKDSSTRLYARPGPCLLSRVFQPKILMDICHPGTPLIRAVPTKGENIVRPELRPQAEAHALVVPSSRK